MRNDADISYAGMTRREFIVRLSALAAGAGAANRLLARDDRRARVVLVRHEKVLDDEGRIQPQILQEMLDQGICALFGTRTAAEAWRQLVRPADQVGIKSNVWRPLRTPVELEEALQRRIQEAGVASERIRVDDRGARQTLADCTVLINARPLRTHAWSGVGGCIKNLIMFVEKPSAYHPDMCADLATIWQLPQVRGKVKLNVLVVLTPQFYTAGPHHYERQYTWAYKGLLLSTDPVAVDAVGVKLLEQKRRAFFGEERSLQELARHVRIADEKHKLGVADLGRIDLVKIGWEHEILL
ncbi:MAG: DUF362 domain-containing protein [Limisphaera sp.]|nr:DUF362 domain-containing protein [Limisphaera sp.]